MMARLTTPFRFSLSTFFLLITILCVFLGLKVRQVHLQRQATVWVLDHGGTIVYEHQFMGPSHTSERDLGPPVRNGCEPSLATTTSSLHLGFSFSGIRSETYHS